MTDEDKAEEYVVCNHCANYMQGKCHSKKCVKLYLEGLAEGRKDVREHETTCVNRLHHIEKENAELKAQNEKMKCCYNCKHGRIYFVEEIIVDCLANKVNSNNKFNNCDKWELAE